MDRSSGSACRLRNGFRQEIGRRLDYLPVSQHRRQHVAGGEHDLLQSVSLILREHDLDRHRSLFYSQTKASNLRLGRLVGRDRLARRIVESPIVSVNVVDRFTKWLP